MEKMKILKVVLVSVIVSLAIHFLFQYFEWRDEQVEKGAEKYEACVKAEYALSPAQYYAENGVYPLCNY